MLYTSKQAANILGTSISTISKLVLAGKLQAEPRVEGNKRAHFQFKPSVIREFKKIYKNRLNGNGKRIKRQNLEIPNPTGIQTRLTNLESKVHGLEEKIDYLVKLWS